MLRLVPIHDLRVGMFLDRVEGAWLEHTLWRSRFLVGDGRVLATVQQSGARACWIDTERGDDVPPAAPQPPPQVAAAVVEPAAPSKPLTLDDELGRAGIVCKNVRAQIKAIFEAVRRSEVPDLAPAHAAVDDVVATVMRHAGALPGLARVKPADDQAALHAVAVSALMVMLARELGFDEKACHDAGLAGLLHDVGEALLPAALLASPRPLTQEAHGEWMTHTGRGHALLRQSGLAAGSGVLDVCLHHHAALDGGEHLQRAAGTPAMPTSAMAPGQVESFEPAAAQGISLLARMAAICDSYDVLTSPRPVGEGCDPAVALGRLVADEMLYDRTVLAAFIRGIGVFPTGSLVRLASGKLAVVVEHRVAHPRLPLVRVFYSTKSDEPVHLHVLDLADKGVRDRIVGLEPRDKWSFTQIDRLWAPPALC